VIYIRSWENQNYNYCTVDVTQFHNEIVHWTLLKQVRYANDHKAGVLGLMN